MLKMPIGIWTIADFWVVGLRWSLQGASARHQLKCVIGTAGMNPTTEGGRDRHPSVRGGTLVVQGAFHEEVKEFGGVIAIIHRQGLLLGLQVYGTAQR